MFFSNLFKKKEIIESPSDLENEYIKVDNNSNIYGFQDKFYMQSDRLLKVFGPARDTIPASLKVLTIADSHNSLNEQELVNTINEHPDYDVCILLGDHSAGDIDKVLKYIPKDKIYALLGNHDFDYITNYGFNNLNGNIVIINGVKIMGIQGSFKYKPVDFPSFTQEDSVKFLMDRESVDILFSHDGPFDDEMINNPAHQGLFGITYYLFKNKVKYNVHGHLHEDYDKVLKNGTTEKCLFGINYIELN